MSIFESEVIFVYEELLQVNDGNVVTTSVLVAEKFNKSHKAIIQKVESLIKELEFCFKLSRFAYFEKSSLSLIHI